MPSIESISVASLERTSRAAPAALIQAARIAAMYDNVPVTLLGNLLTAAAICLSLHLLDATPSPNLVCWLLLMAAQLAVRGLLWQSYRRLRPPPAEAPAWAAYSLWGSFVSGLVWGPGTLMLLMPASDSHQLLLIVALTGMCAAGVHAVGAYFPAFAAYLVPTLLPTAAWSAWQDTPFHWVVAVLVAIFGIAMLKLARQTHDSLGASLELRFENLDLLEDLRVQTAAAEQASLAKSRFLAAASHDLRQPMHALQLFVGALGERNIDAEARRLVGHLGDSVAAMESLFSALLDISRLDAGIIEVNRRAFPLQPVIDRVVRHHLPEAERKDLAVSVVASSAWIESDPVLVERILHNLVSNAVRHTRAGRILIGCRRGHGTLRIQITDTGPGIAPEHQDEVFDEFVQLHNPERDRTQGLGLGLAIVRRLTTLLGHALVMQSRPGCGTTFALGVPCTAPREESCEPAAPIAAAPVDKTIIVVDDESAVRVGTETLLRGWGYRVLTGATLEELHAGLARANVAPDLVIADYRLGASESGIGVIARLRADYGKALPGVLVTGDTAEERLREAKESGFTLLHKPVAPAKLRAVVGNLLR